jgi:hypothetical protein
MKTSLKRFTVNLIQDPDSDDLILPLPDELMDDLGWDIGDTLNWKTMDNGEIVLTKMDKENMLLNNRVSIAGILYQINRLPADEINGLLGTADFNKQCININRDATATTQEIAVLHEIIHIISDAWGLKLTEEQVKIGTHALISFLKENKNFRVDL